MNNSKFISICIPTFNRASNLKKNLLVLEHQISTNHLRDDVCIIVSDNASMDNTKKVLEDFKKSSSVEVITIFQEYNTGAEVNQLQVGETANSDFVMLLGDDDYLNDNYLIEVYKLLKDDPSISCVIPNFRGITPTGEILFCRDDTGVKTLYEPGFNSCLDNSWKAHQLSGLTFRRKGLYEKYRMLGVHNLYPQIFLIATSCLCGRCVYLPEFPVEVTQVPQANKDWGYGSDGLMNDIFDNYKYLGLGIFQRARLECRFLETDPSRYLMYKTRRKRYWATFRIMMAKNLSFIGRFYVFNEIVHKFYCPDIKNIVKHLMNLLIYHIRHLFFLQNFRK